MNRVGFNLRRVLASHSYSQQRVSARRCRDLELQPLSAITSFSRSFSSPSMPSGSEFAVLYPSVNAGLEKVKHARERELQLMTESPADIKSRIWTEFESNGIKNIRGRDIYTLRPAVESEEDLRLMFNILRAILLDERRPNSLHLNHALRSLFTICHQNGWLDLAKEVWRDEAVAAFFAKNPSKGRMLYYAAHLYDSGEYAEVAAEPAFDDVPIMFTAKMAALYRIGTAEAFEKATRLQRRRAAVLDKTLHGRFRADHIYALFASKVGEHGRGYDEVYPGPNPAAYVSFHICSMLRVKLMAEMGRLEEAVKIARSWVDAASSMPRTLVFPNEVLTRLSEQIEGAAQTTLCEDWDELLPFLQRHAGDDTLEELIFKNISAESSPLEAGEPGAKDHVAFENSN